MTCKKGCGFNGAARFKGYCSVCYKMRNDKDLQDSDPVLPPGWFLLCDRVAEVEGGISGGHPKPQVFVFPRCVVVTWVPFGEMNKNIYTCARDYQCDVYLPERNWEAVCFHAIGNWTTPVFLGDSVYSLAAACYGSLNEFRIMSVNVNSGYRREENFGPYVDADIRCYGDNLEDLLDPCDRFFQFNNLFINPLDLQRVDENVATDLPSLSRERPLHNDNDFNDTISAALPELAKHTSQKELRSWTRHVFKASFGDIVFSYDNLAVKTCAIAPSHTFKVHRREPITVVVMMHIDPPDVDSVTETVEMAFTDMSGKMIHMLHVSPKAEVPPDFWAQIALHASTDELSLRLILPDGRVITQASVVRQLVPGTTYAGLLTKAVSESPSGKGTKGNGKEQLSSESPKAKAKGKGSSKGKRKKKMSEAGLELRPLRVDERHVVVGVSIISR